MESVMDLEMAGTMSDFLTVNVSFEESGMHACTMDAAAVISQHFVPFYFHFRHDTNSLCVHK